MIWIPLCQSSKAGRKNADDYFETTCTRIKLGSLEVVKPVFGTKIVKCGRKIKNQCGFRAFCVFWESIA